MASRITCERKHVLPVHHRAQWCLELPWLIHTLWTSGCSKTINGAYQDILFSELQANTFQYFGMLTISARNSSDCFSSLSSFNLICSFSFFIFKLTWIFKNEFTGSKLKRHALSEALAELLQKANGSQSFKKCPPSRSVPWNRAVCTSKDIPWDSLWPSVFLLTLQKCSAEVAWKLLKVLNASAVIWYKRKRNSSVNREAGIDCSSVCFTWCSLVLQRAHLNTAVVSFTVLSPREDCDLFWGAGELGRCGGVEIVIYSGDFQTRNRSVNNSTNWLTSEST